MTDTKTLPTMSERVRERLRKRLGSTPPCPTCKRSTSPIPDAIAAHIGVSNQTLAKFLSGSSVSGDTLDRIVTWLDAQSEKK